ncbi:MAG: VOC family protein [Proteobacteria bacterium]|nr:VOC family protein [Pseudomonadota bacterium]
MSDLGLTHVALPSSNLERSIEFYARYARMEVVHRREGAVWLSDKTRPFVIVLLAASEVSNPLVPFAHLGVGCESREEVERLSSLAESEGCLVGGPNDYGPPVGYWSFIRDPDGHTLEVSFGQEVGLTVERAGKESDS